MIEVYLDYNGSSPLDPRVGKAMWPALAEWYGNASSTHRFGRRQAAAVEDARARVARRGSAKPTFARHETFHPRYGWFRKAYAVTKQDPQIFTREDALSAILGRRPGGCG